MKLVVAPDRGWAWVVAFAACFINMVLSGLTRSVAMLYVEVIDSFKVSRQDATLPFTVRNAIRCISAPIVGLAGQHFQIRTITFWGSLLSAIGSCLCATAPNIFWLTIFWGIINGFGFAFGNTLSVLVVNQYFNKHKATACGIALSGGCLGCLVFPFMIEAITSNFDMSGSFLILGGVIMQVLPLAILMNSPPWVKHDKQKETKNGKNIQSRMDVLGNEEDKITRCESIRTVSFTGCPSDNLQILNIIEKSCMNDVIQNENIIDDQLHNDDDITRNDILTMAINYGLDHRNGQENPSIQLCHQETKAISEPEIEKKEEETIPKKSSNGIFANFFLHFIKLYSNTLYILLSVCLASYAIIYILVSTIIVDYGKDKGLSESSGKYLIISVAIGDLIGRLCFGWITDRKFLSAQKFSLLMYVIQGVLTAAFPLSNDFVIFLVLLTLYGISSGSSLVVIPTLVVEYTTVEEQPLAMSCLNFFAGFVSFGISPVIGYFRDDIGSYDGLFLIAGGISLFCGILWFLEPQMVKFQKSRARNLSVAATTNRH